MKYFFSIFFSVFLISTIVAQENRIEEVYQECAYNSLSDKGKNIKRYTKEFERYLIKINILKDGSSKSYYNLYKSFSEGKRYNTNNFEYSYSDSINKNREDRLKIFPISKKCLEEIKNHKAFYRFKNNKLLKSNIIEKTNVNDIIKENLEIIEKKDFSLDYYKHRTFALFYLLNDF